MLLALISTGGILITGLASVSVAWIANRRESKNAANESADVATLQQLSVKDERISLRDEQIKLKEAQLTDCYQKHEAAQSELQGVCEDLAHARTELSALRAELAKLRESTDGTL